MTASQELEQAGLLARQVRAGPTIRMRSTYRGLVWTTRKDLTVESRFVDELVAEWGTANVDLKREVHTNTADVKAELIKDVLRWPTPR